MPMDSAGFTVGWFGEVLLGVRHLLHGRGDWFLAVAVATTISCHDLTVPSHDEIYVMTSISSRDINSVASHFNPCHDNVFLPPQ